MSYRREAAKAKARKWFKFAFVVLTLGILLTLGEAFLADLFNAIVLAVATIFFTLALFLALLIKVSMIWVNLPR